MVGILIAALSALASMVASIFAGIAAVAARRQAELLRPRPIVVIKAEWTFGANKTTLEGSESFLLYNVGSSPAFDVAVSEIHGPSLGPSGMRDNLVTDKIFVLAPDMPIVAEHHRQQVAGNVFGKAREFVQGAHMTFPREDESGNRTLTHVVGFSVTYASLEGKRYRTQCRLFFDVDPFNPRVWVEPVSSWLGEEN